MEFLQPAVRDEALEAKAAHPGAMPLRGGTDVMVRARPEAVLDLRRGAALSAYRRHVLAVMARRTLTGAWPA